MKKEKYLQPVSVDADIMLFAFQPNGHGEYSFFVIEKNEDAAINAVNKYISEHSNKDDRYYIDRCDINGWGTDYYKLTKASIGEVITHTND